PRSTIPSWPSRWRKRATSGCSGQPQCCGRVIRRMAVNRDQHEKDLAAALAVLLRQYGDIAARDPTRIPWARFERELAAAIVPELLASHIASATQMASGIKGFDLSDEQAAAAAQKWAQA